jgi:hypothetical protein
LLHPELIISNNINLDYYNTYASNTDHISDMSLSQINDKLDQNDNSNSNENTYIKTFATNQRKQLLDYVSNVKTSMEKYMDDLKDNNTIADYQRFTSLNVVSSSDGNFYKIVNSNCEDTINKIFTFDNYTNLRNQNFTTNLDPQKKRDLNPLKQFDQDNYIYSNLLLSRSDIDANICDVIHCPLPKNYSSSVSVPSSGPYSNLTIEEYKLYIEAKLLLFSLSDDLAGLDNA